MKFARCNVSIFFLSFCKNRCLLLKLRALYLIFARTHTIIYAKLLKNRDRFMRMERENGNFSSVQRISNDVTCSKSFHFSISDAKDRTT